ncbi:MAG: penicillin-binding protein 2 [Chloroflexi bacterium]|nr:penicillin-binding protein 2 [Chloroflexota bacterium]
MSPLSFRKKRRNVPFLMALLLGVGLGAGLLALAAGLEPGGPVASGVAAPTAGSGAAGPGVGGTGGPVATVGSGGPAATASALGAPTAMPATRTAAIEVAGRYLRAWEEGRYGEMYALVTGAARQATPEERFVNRYRAITSGATITSVKAALTDDQSGGSGPVPSGRVELGFRATLATARLGEIVEENRLPLVYEENRWQIDWSPGLIFRELTPDRAVRFFPADAVRGPILDRNGVPLAVQDRVLTLGVVPGRIEDLERVVKGLAEYLKIEPDVVRRKIAAAQPEWWVPFRDFPLSKRGELGDKFGEITGVEGQEKAARVYPHGAAGAHVVGYVSPVNAADLKALAAKGYEEGDVVGRTGVERWAEETLAGVPGGELVIVNANGSTVRTVAKRAAQNGGTVRLTIDVELQKGGERILGDKVGSLVMIDPRDNAIVALASTPSFDPNGFILGFSEAEWHALADDPRQPFQARANLSTYPSGSVFKIVTMAAGLERGGYQPNTMFDCNGKWPVLDPRNPRGDWLPQGHGRLSLAQGLVESCDIVFYELGHKLNQLDPKILADFARQFGLGAATGAQGLSEAEGTVPDPDWKQKDRGEPWYAGDAVNLAIGQGYLETTPLQVANMYSAVAAGGKLRTPLLVRSITPPGAGAAGTPPQEHSAQERGQLPLSPRNLGVIREALKGVTATARGTANYAFRGYRLPVAGKTGSAENQNPDEHAWFAGFGPADAPQLVVVAMIEGGKAGGSVAAPLGRQAFELVLGR